jgi:GNAT superfamily N-acetyltransferase
MADSEETAATLRDGRSITLSAAAVADSGEIAQLLETAADPRPGLRAGAAVVEGANALIARGVAQAELVGYAVWIRGEDGRAELLCVVDDAFAGVGLGTLLLRRAAAGALDAGVRTLRVELLPQARGLAAMLRDCGLHSSWALAHPVAHVDLLLGTARPGWATP